MPPKAKKATARASASIKKSQSGTAGKRPMASRAQSRRASVKANVVAEIVEPYTSDEDASAAAKPGRTKRSGTAQVTGNKRKRKQGGASRRVRGSKTQKRGATTLPETEVEPTSDDGAGKVGGQGNGSATVEKGTSGAADPGKVRDAVPPQWLFYVPDLGTTKEEGRTAWDTLSDEDKAEQRKKYVGTRLPNVVDFQKAIDTLEPALKARFEKKSWKATPNNGRRALWDEAASRLPDAPLKVARANRIRAPEATRLVGVGDGSSTLTGQSKKKKKKICARKKVPKDMETYVNSLGTNTQLNHQVRESMKRAARHVELANRCAAAMGGPLTTAVLTFVGAGEAAGPGFNTSRMRMDFSGRPDEQRITVLGAVGTACEAVGRAAMTLAMDKVGVMAGVQVPAAATAELKTITVTTADAGASTPVNIYVKDAASAKAVDTDRRGFRFTNVAGEFLSRAMLTSPGDDQHDTSAAQRVSDVAAVTSAAGPTVVADNVAAASLSQLHDGHLSDTSAAHPQAPAGSQTISEVESEPLLEA